MTLYHQNKKSLTVIAVSSVIVSFANTAIKAALVYSFFIKKAASFTKDDLTIHDLESLNEYVLNKTIVNLEQDILKCCNGFNTVVDIENLVPKRQYPKIHGKLRDTFSNLVAKKIIEVGEDHIPRIIVKITEGASPQ